MRHQAGPLVIVGCFVVTLGHGAARADSYLYDSADRLVRVQRGDLVETFAYDGEGHLLRTCSRRRGEPATCRSVLVDPSVEHARVVAEVRGPRRVTVHAHGPEGVELVRADEGVARGVLRDHQRSVVGEVGATGALVGRRAFTPWGRPRTSVGSFVATHGFAGELTGPSGLVYLRARHYDPAIGRFLQHDAFAGVPTRAESLNRYAYAHANPLVHRDPSGHWIETAFDVGSLALSVNDLVQGWDDAGAWGRLGLVSGVVLDGAGVLLPIVPAGVGYLRQVRRLDRALGNVPTGARHVPDRALDRAMRRVARDQNVVISARARDPRAARFDPNVPAKAIDFPQVGQSGSLRFGMAPGLPPRLRLMAMERGAGLQLATPDLDLGGIVRVGSGGGYEPVRLGTRARPGQGTIIDDINEAYARSAGINSFELVTHGEQTSGFLEDVEKLWSNFDKYWEADVDVWSPDGYLGQMPYREFVQRYDPEAFDTITSLRSSRGLP